METEVKNTNIAASKAGATLAEDVKRFTIDLPTDLHLALKLKAATLRLTMRDYVISLLEAALQEKPDQNA